MEETLSTRVLATNIHCSSCVAKIEECLQRLGSDILSVSVDVVNQQVTVVHRSNDVDWPSRICSALADEAFEVCSASCVDKAGNVVSELDFDDASSSSSANSHWWRSLSPGAGARAIVPSSLRPSLARTTSAPGATIAGKRRPRHVENCAACRGELHDPEHAARASGKADVKLLSRPTTLSHLPHDRLWPQRETSVSRLRATASRDGPSSDGWPESKSSPPDAPRPASPPVRSGSQEKRGRRSPVADVATSDISSDRSPDQPKRFSMEMSVGGMTCSSCSNAIRDATSSLDGVLSARVDLVSNSAVVEFEGDEDFATTVIQAIEDIGYEASITTLTPLGPSKPRKGDKHAKKPQDNRFKAVLGLGGMTCASCSNAIAEGLQQLPYVNDVEVTLLTNSGTVTFEGRTHLDTIMERVEDLGYEVSLNSCETLVQSDQESAHSAEGEARTVQLRIDGMFCEHCPDRISKSLKEAFPNIAIERPPTLDKPVITVSYVPESPGRTIRDIADAIHGFDAKFHVSPYKPPSLEERSQHLQRLERKHTLRRLILSAIVAIPTLIIGVVYMSLVPESDSVREFFDMPIWAGNVARSDWALFILATPVYFFATDVFHRRAIKEIKALWRKGSRVPILRRFYRFGSMNMLISAGTTVAYISSVILLAIEAADTRNTPSSGTYFDSVVFLTFFILIGRYLEAYSKSKAGNAVSMLSNLRPEQALVVSEKASKQSSADTDGEKGGSSLATSTESVLADFLEVGDTIIVPRGASPPADSVLLSSAATFDESSLTGESRPVAKSAGDEIFIGTINTGNPVRARVVKLGGASMLDQIVAVVREGQTRRAPVERVVDIVTGYFVPIITLLAVTTFFVWFALGQSGALDQRYLDGHAGGWAFWSLEFAVAVFVVACPCGIGLAAPTALFVGGGLAARRGILVRGGGEAFQEASDLDAVVFDKTGTLTEGGDLKVTDHEVFARGEEDGLKDAVWPLARALEENSGHPLAQAIVAFARERSGTSVELVDVEETPGMGLRGEFVLPVSPSSNDIRRYEAAIGSEPFISSFDKDLISNNTFATQHLSTWKTQAKSVVVLATRPKPNLTESDTPLTPLSHSGWTIVAILATADPLRPSAAPTVAALQGRGISVYMLSGDNPTTAAAVAAQVGIPAANVFAGVLPTQKAEQIRWLQEHGSRRNKKKNKSASTRAFDDPAIAASRQGSSPSDEEKGVPDHDRTTPAPSSHQAKVAFVGDGINDAPALLQSSVSISLATGSPIALTSSSFVLVQPSLESVVALLDLSRRVFRRIRLNFAWAMAYNLVLVPVAAGVLFRVRADGWRLGPVWAAAAMALSSVSVVLSSLALRLDWREFRTGGALRRWRKGGRSGADGKDSDIAAGKDHQTQELPK